MELIPDWRRYLLGAWSSRFGLLSAVFGAAAGALFVFADDLGDGPYFTLVIVFAALSWVCSLLVPAARVVRQGKLSDAD